MSAIESVPDKQYASDPMPTCLPKDCTDILAPFFVELLNQSLRTGSVPTVFKEAYITSLIEKADLDVDDVRSYPPISNLPALSNLLELSFTCNFWITSQRKGSWLHSSLLTDDFTP